MKGILRNSRNQDWYRVVTKELEELGIDNWEIKAPTGKGHPKLVINHQGRTFKMPVPSSEKGSSNHKYMGRRIRHEFLEKFLEARAA